MVDEGGAEDRRIEVALSLLMVEIARGDHRQQNDVQRTLKGWRQDVRGV